MHINVQQATRLLPHWVLGWVLALHTLCSFAAPALDFPHSPVKMIVPFPPGGPTDTLGRLIGISCKRSGGSP